MSWPSPASRASTGFSREPINRPSPRVALRPRRWPRRPPGASAPASPATASSGGSVPCSISINSSGPTITLDLTKDGGGLQVVEAAGEAQPDLKKVCREVASPEFQRALVEQMARELTGDRNFTDALAAAILRKLPDY
ncbi:WRKY transcription factor 3 [Hordeum vulgare]|nr:WRKY transcription factor 3 [Hordeum vulgare]